MTSSRVAASAYAIELDPPHSGRLLAKATRANADVAVLPQNRMDGSPTIAGIERSTDEGLLIRPRGRPLEDPAALVSVYCEATIELDGMRLLFNTNVIDAFTDANGVALEIAKPVHLHVIQRRRFGRRDLRSRTAVRITPMNAEDRPPVEGSLLNISAGGMACRVDSATGADCSVGSCALVEFALAECHQPFHLPVQVRGHTPGASNQRVILSLEFVRSIETEADRARLAEALYFDAASLTAG
jgi:c-di-GMP-binding flagellar brake protein YcgR